MNLKALQGKFTREFLESLKGGATINPYSLTKVTRHAGYQVAVTNNICEESEIADMIAKVAWECRGLMNNPYTEGTFAVGVWFDGKVWYVDQSVHIYCKYKAIEIAKKHDQQSIFGWIEMDCIDTFGTGGKN